MAYPSLELFLTVGFAAVRAALYIKPPHTGGFYFCVIRRTASKTVFAYHPEFGIIAIDTGVTA